MTLLFADSFDHYTTMPSVKGWLANPASQGNATIGAFGRNGTNGLRCADPRQGDMQVLPSVPAAVVVGAAVKVSGLFDSQLIALLDTGTIQVDLRLTANGALRVTRNGAVLGTSAIGLIAPNAYNYVELKSVIDPAVGTAVVKLNGVTVLNLAGQNTRATATSQVTHVSLCGFNNGIVGITVDFDDLYICDTLGVRNNDFLGDVRIQAVLPNGPGNYTQWDGLVGPTHWQAQDENPPDGDASYVSDTLAIPGHLDSYAMGNLTPTSGTVPAVQVSAWARKDDAGARTMATMVRSAAVDAVGAAVGLVNTYGYVTQVYELDPSAAAWTIASVNGAEAGVKAVA